jgi:hypothetical protein
VIFYSWRYSIDLTWTKIFFINSPTWIAQRTARSVKLEHRTKIDPSISKRAFELNAACMSRSSILNENETILKVRVARVVCVGSGRSLSCVHRMRCSSRRADEFHTLNTRLITNRSASVYENCFTFQSARR